MVHTLFMAPRSHSMYGGFDSSFERRRIRCGLSRPHMGVGADMTLSQALLLVLSFAVMGYLGVALFKAEWF